MDEQIQTAEQIQSGNTDQALAFHTHNGIDSPPITISEAQFNLSDVTSANVTSTKHGFAPKSPADATKFLNGATTPDYANVKDSDLALTDVTSNNVTTSAHGLVPKAPNDTTKFLRGDATWNTPTIPILIDVTSGEILAAGEVVRLYLAVGSYASDGYAMSNGSVYACRAAANDTTYGVKVIGLAYAAMTYQTPGKVIVCGYASGLSGLTGAAVQYLDNYAAASSQTISQLNQDAEQQFTAGVTVVQLWTPTESRFDKIIVKARKNGGGACTLSCAIKRGSTTLATPTVDLGANSGSLAEFTLDPADFQTYKGETLTLNFTTDTTSGYIGYKSGGSTYNGGASGGSIPANSDVYFKINEVAGFGKLNTTAGTRKVKLGNALSATEMLVQLQIVDANL